MRDTRPQQTQTPGERLADKRRSRDLDQTQAGARVGASQSQFSRIERGEATPTLPQAIAIEREFGIPAALWIENERQSA